MKRRVAIALSLAVTAIGAAAAVDAVIGGDPDRSLSTEPQATLAPEAGGLRLEGSVEVERPAGLTILEGSVFASSVTAGTVVRIDAEREVAETTIDVGGRPGMLASSGGKVYVFDQGPGDAVVVDASSNAVERRLPGFAAAFGATFADGDAWVPDPASWTVVRLDPDDGAVRSRISSPSPTSIAGDDAGVWVVSPAERTLTRIDPASNLVLATVAFDDVPGGVVVGAGGVWVSHPGAGAVSRVDPETNEVVARVELGNPVEPLVLAADAHGVWVLGVSRLLRVDPATNRVAASAPFALTRRPGPSSLVLGGLAVSGSTAWVADTYGGRVLWFSDVEER